MAESTPTPRTGTAGPTLPPGDRVAERRARLWAVLQDDATPQAEYFAAWLALQCESLPGAGGGLLLLRTAEGGSHPQAVWPAAVQPAPRDTPPRDTPARDTFPRDIGDLTRLGERALAEARLVVAWGRPATQGATANGTVALLIAQPLGPDGTPHAVVAVALAVPGGIERADPEAIGGQLRAAVGWLDA